jgi:hypothetical protein
MKVSLSNHRAELRITSDSLSHELSGLNSLPCIEFIENKMESVASALEGGGKTSPV